MDIDILRQIGVVLGSIAFLAICWWAFSPKRKKRFEEDAKLPFADEQETSDKAARESETSTGEKAGEKQEQGQDK
ncbi:cbb3-type cytochrome oxidase subunit 3 [Microbulbifer hydrolyticus]|uniref:CcoQ/FixQ family Cbb3-type cytochrome c oxidase assembly chaperone n=1 Tax=Microbulbifer hydrolyticus TaxID=48074 RepID=A0A6P1T949_9GAMM|nr:cbb3-type cytochrome c oxidase subunit 3 [Microbulbifer hydrolyticus]MBB5213281.1 cytochrome c oxidase cbb3-type subunit 4 [Microbulbifer hydrolyticus]QHQ38557.1 CcoQ/FixQ family Cbb3-type cytochrome c oxidase assembly chaperone [Microbulbifer hydrolyticus]